MTSVSAAAASCALQVYLQAGSLLWHQLMSLGSVDALVAPDGRREECGNVDVVLQHAGRGGQITDPHFIISVLILSKVLGITRVSLKACRRNSWTYSYCS